MRVYPHIGKEQGSCHDPAPVWEHAVIPGTVHSTVPQQETNPVISCLPEEVDIVSGRLTVCQPTEKQEQSRLPKLERVRQTSTDCLLHGVGWVHEPHAYGARGEDKLWRTTKTISERHCD
jgi:hypothetical protein